VPSASAERIGILLFNLGGLTRAQGEALVERHLGGV